MRTVLAAILTAAMSTFAFAATDLHMTHAGTTFVSHSRDHLTAKQKKWFGRAVEHILRGER